MNDETIHNEYPDPWDRGTYQTGSVEPPKSRSGLVAVLLIAVILLAGITTILGVMNIRLFSQLKDQTDGTVGLSLKADSDSSIAGSLCTESISDTAPAVPRDEVTIRLEEPPKEMANVPQEGGLSLQQIYAQCIDAVVSISCQSTGSNSSGTGVVISENGYIVTNCHVVENAQVITVQLTDDRVFRASLVGADTASDLAVLYVDAQDLTPAQFGDSENLRVGDAVCAIGDPLGVELRGTMTNGIISAINRDITTGGRTMTLIQTNAALNSGNSGGPLINCYGQVIGINTMKIGDYMSDAGVEGLGFAIPSTTVKSVVDQLIRQGYVSGRPSLGLTGESVSALYQYYYRLPQGLFITEITAGSDAESKGLQTGDILISLDGTKITTAEELTTALYAYEVGDTIQAVIYRNNKQYSVELTVEEAKG